MKQKKQEKSDFSVCEEFENVMQLSGHDRVESPHPSSKKTAGNSPQSEDYKQLIPLRIGYEEKK